MADTEQIINAVRERRCLYDHCHADFKRPDIKNNNWKEICRALELPDSDKDGKKTIATANNNYY